MLKDFSKEQFDIVLQAGQSNSEGSGIGNALKPFQPSEDIWYLNNDFTISKAQELVSGNNIVGNFSLSFAGEYANKGVLDKGRKLLIIRAAVGGTGFLDKRWGMQDDLFLRMMEMIKTALVLNSQNRLVTFLWHQGETDAILKADYKTHYKNLSALINSVRYTFDCDKLPFLAADFVKQWKNDNYELCEPVVNAMQDICGSIGNAQFIDSEGLQSNDQKLGNGDTIHFCRESLNQLGSLYFNAFCKIC